MTDAAAIEVQSIRRFKADSPSFAVEFIGEVAAFVLTDESVLLLSPDQGERLQRIHGGAILACAADGRRLLTAGDDGRVVAVDCEGRTACVVADDRGRWIDHLTADHEGSLVWSIGKHAFWRSARWDLASIDLPSSVGGLALAPDGRRVAIAHYNGVTLWQPGTDSTRVELLRKGSHQLPRFSPDGRVLVTAMREPTLHAWNLANGKDLLVPGFPARIRSIDWSADGRFLATSGSNRVTLLSFQIDDNPLARMPLLLAPYGSVVAAVACHPTRNIVAAGYADGLVLLIRIPDGAEIVIKTPDASAVAALRWSRMGTQLGIGSENGQCRVVAMR